jgi:hypothetical protein
VKEIDARVPLYPNDRGATLGRRLFVRSVKAHPKVAGIEVHTLEDLYRLRPVS